MLLRTLPTLLPGVVFIFGENNLRSPYFGHFLTKMYLNQPDEMLDLLFENFLQKKSSESFDMIGEFLLTQQYMVVDQKDKISYCEGVP